MIKLGLTNMILPTITARRVADDSVVDNLNYFPSQSLGSGQVIWNKLYIKITKCSMLQSIK